MAHHMLPTRLKHRDKTLFTPGPLSTSQAVKQAMLFDLGSRDLEFAAIVRDINGKLLQIAKVSRQEYCVVPMQGSGTFGVEAIIGSSIARNGKLLVIENGLYGRRLAQIGQVLNIEIEVISFRENEIPNMTQVEQRLAQSDATHVAMVHCETSTGMLNPLQEIGMLAHRYDKCFIVDAMSSFGGIPIDIQAAHIDFLVSSSNKCVEGVPGCSFVIAKQVQMQQCEGRARSVSLDLYAQWKGLENAGQFRFTPPTHVMLALRQALAELIDEGGVESRSQRYQANCRTLVAGMAKLGFVEYLPREIAGHIISAFLYPDDKNFDFSMFYDKLNQRGFVIYPGKLSDAACFRIGNIGRIFQEDMQSLLLAIGEVKNEMGF